MLEQALAIGLVVGTAIAKARRCMGSAWRWRRSAVPRG